MMLTLLTVSGVSPRESLLVKRSRSTSISDCTSSTLSLNCVLNNLGSLVGVVEGIATTALLTGTVLVYSGGGGDCTSTSVLGISKS